MKLDFIQLFIFRFSAFLVKYFFFSIFIHFNLFYLVFCFWCFWFCYFSFSGICGVRKSVSFKKKTNENNLMKMKNTFTFIFYYILYKMKKRKKVFNKLLCISVFWILLLLETEISLSSLHAIYACRQLNCDVFFKEIQLI